MGAKDQIFSLAQGEKTYELVPQSEIEVIPGCGHLLVIECCRKSPLENRKVQPRQTLGIGDHINLGDLSVVKRKAQRTG